MRSFLRLLSHPVTRLAPAALLAAALAACGGPPKQEGFNRLYRGLSEPLPRIEPTVLSGRRILIDPGHGGVFDGTTGRDSLTEASVNLGVSLYLWGLLNDAGAEAYITRSADRDFLSEQDSSLASDLRTRVALADSLKPDVLISIHHNAQPRRDPSRNRVETYYRAGDPASLDLAFAIHRHLMRNLGIETGVVRQGNYLILRESTVPAVLGESSYLTNPSVESRLKLSEAQKLEAEAYFLGLLEYFDRGIPRTNLVSPADSVHTDSIPAIVFALEDDGGTGIDPDGISLTINGSAVIPVTDDAVRTVFYQPPWDLANGTYELSLSVRNLGGNTSAIHTERFTVDFSPVFAAFDFTPAQLPARGGFIRVRVRFLDRRGKPVRNGTGCRVYSSATPDTVSATVQNGSIDVLLPSPPGESPVQVGAMCAGRTFENVIEPAAAPDQVSRSIFVRDALTGKPVKKAVVNYAGRGMHAVSGAGTFVYTAPERQAGGDTSQVFVLQAPGYRPAPPTVAGAAPGDTVSMVPWFEGVLHGVRFVLDPEGGPAGRTGQGPLGLSGSHANLQVAKYLAGFLRMAGSEVMLTRTNEEVRTPEDIARMTNRYRADRYLEIRHRVSHTDSLFAVRTHCFPGSRNGLRMAGSVLTQMTERLGVDARGPYETVTYPLQQTACPAIIVEAPSIGRVDEELRLAESWYQREQAYAVFLGILDHYAAPDSGRVLVTIKGEDRAGWKITLDGTWTLVTGDSGSVQFEKIPAGVFRLSAFKSDRHVAATVVVEPDRPVEVPLDPAR
jgi:N-acetylmuramoyl-L-alanine amidase